MIKIRNELSSDAAAIEAITLAAFKNAAHADHTEQFIVRALRSAGALSISLVAEDAGTVVGHAAVSPVSISSGVADWYGLGPIAVVPERQGIGIGSQLMQAVLDTLRESNAYGCVVLGDPGYYSRFGFFADSRLVLPGVPPEYFQVLSFKGPMPTGTVCYHEAFSAKN